MKFKSIVGSSLIGLVACSSGDADSNTVDVGTEVASSVWAEVDGGNDHHYVLMAAPKGIRWIDAATAAEDMGGYLATVADAEENEVVFSLAQETSWPVDSSTNEAQGPALGGQVSDGLWGWRSGELWTYTAFAEGQPDNWEAQADAENALQLRGAEGSPAPTWSDIFETDKVFSYIVEIEHASDGDDSETLDAGTDVGVDTQQDSDASANESDTSDSLEMTDGGAEPEEGETPPTGSGVVEVEDDPQITHIYAACPPTKIDLLPTDVDSSTSDQFSTLPTADPTLFGFSGSDVRSANFEFDPEGNAISPGTEMVDEYASIGLTMNHIAARDDAFQGAASAPNVAWIDSPHIYTFTVPVSAVGFINTSPDQDTMEFWSGPNRTGTLLIRFSDAPPGNFETDSFLGARACPEQTIGSVAVYNHLGNLELDELIFEAE